MDIHVTLPTIYGLTVHKTRTGDRSQLRFFMSYMDEIQDVTVLVARALDLKIHDVVHHLVIKTHPSNAQEFVIHIAGIVGVRNIRYMEL